MTPFSHSILNAYSIQVCLMWYTDKDDVKRGKSINFMFCSAIVCYILFMDHQGLTLLRPWFLIEGGNMVGHLSPQYVESSSISNRILSIPFLFQFKTGKSVNLVSRVPPLWFPAGLQCLLALDPTPGLSDRLTHVSRAGTRAHHPINNLNWSVQGLGATAPSRGTQPPLRDSCLCASLPTTSVEGSSIWTLSGCQHTSEACGVVSTCRAAVLRVLLC